jgi:CDP-diacylglycerol pyrophosphatase
LYHEDNKPNYTLFAGERRKGIECPKIWQMGAPNYWQFALNAGEKYLKHPHRIGLAINSRAARTECQLHIHVSCIQKDVQTTLNRHDSDVATDPNTWKNSSHTLPLDYTAKGTGKTSHFRALRLNNLDQNLFRLLRYHVAGNDSEMQYQTLVVTVRPKGGFYILNSTDYKHDMMFGGTGAGEELLDETCS